MTYLLKVDIIRKFHILCMNPKDFKTTSWIRDTNINLPVESSKSTKGGVNGVRTVSSSHYYDIRSGLKTIHKRQKLRYYTTLDFAIRLKMPNGIS